MMMESTLVQTMTQRSKRFWLPESAPEQRHFSEWFLLEGLPARDEQILPMLQETVS